MDRIRLSAAFLVLHMLAFGAQYAGAQEPVWERLPGFDGGLLVRVAVHPRTGTIFANEFDAVFRSTDGGGTWSYAEMYLQMPETVIIDTSGTVYVGSEEGVLYSTDDGVSYTVSQGMAQSVSALEINRNTGSMFAGTYAGTVERSTDRGLTWSAVLYTGNPQDWIDELYCDGNGILFACTGRTKLWKSTDDGITWIHPDNPTINSDRVLAIAGDMDGNKLFIGTDSTVYLSSDQGDTWSSTGFPASVRINSLFLSNNITLFAGTDGGAFVSTDDGISWEHIPMSRPDIRIIHLAVDQTGEGLLAATSDGLHRLDPAAKSWMLIGVPALSITCIKPSRDGRLYVSAENELYVSSDAGMTWNRSGVRGAMSVDVDEKNAIAYSGGSAGIHRSTDRGKTWELSYNLNTVNSVLVQPDGNVLAGAATPSGGALGVYFSSDRGAHWEKRNSGLTDSAVWWVARNPGSGALLLATWNGEMFRSTDEGFAWTPAGEAWPYGIAVCLAADSSGGLLAGTSYGAAYRSTDDAKTWRGLHDGIPLSSSINGFAVNRQGHIFAATAPGGIYRSFDEGKTWSQVVDGLPDRIVWSVAVDEQGYVYAGTWHGGLFRTRFPTVRSEAPPDPGGISLEQASPNPFTQSTAIRFSPAKHCRVRLSVTDALGRECAVLADGNFDPGTHGFRWNAVNSAGSSFPAGMYQFRLTASYDGRLMTRHTRNAVLLK